MTFTEVLFGPNGAEKGRRRAGSFRILRDQGPLGALMLLGAPGAPRSPALRRSTLGDLRDPFRGSSFEPFPRLMTRIWSQ